MQSSVLDPSCIVARWRLMLVRSLSVTSLFVGCARMADKRQGGGNRSRRRSKSKPAQHTDARGRDAVERPSGSDRPLTAIDGATPGVCGSPGYRHRRVGGRHRGAEPLLRRDDPVVERLGDAAITGDAGAPQAAPVPAIIPLRLSPSRFRQVQPRALCPLSCHRSPRRRRPWHPPCRRSPRPFASAWSARVLSKD